MGRVEKKKQQKTKGKIEEDTVNSAGEEELRERKVKVQEQKYRQRKVIRRL